MNDNQTQEKKDLLRNLGAELKIGYHQNLIKMIITL